ncbi:MAG: helix-turn-helix domain-containing protein, partial [Sedimentibacter sp.]
PTLHERKEDILLLADYFVKEECKKRGRLVKPFSEHSKEAMFQYNWPGNVRELHNQIRQLVIKSLHNDNYYTVQLPIDRYVATDKHDVIEKNEENSNKKYNDYEADLIKRTLKSTKGNISKAADMLRIDRNTVYRKMNKYRIQKSDFK